MSTIPSDPVPERRSDAWFVTTRWSVVLSVGAPGSTQAAEALETLCRDYWYPVYAYVRRQGQQPFDAQDSTQEFFARLIRRGSLRTVAPERGRFRTFLLVALKRFLADEWDRARARKRGGGRPLLSLDTADAEARYRLEPTEAESAERIFERRWALALLDRALERLAREHATAEKSVPFERLKHVLTADRGEVSYPELASALGLTEGAARVAVHRLRRRFRELLREEVSHTVATETEIDDELRHLVSLFGG